MGVESGTIEPLAPIEFLVLAIIWYRLCESPQLVLKLKPNRRTKQSQSYVIPEYIAEREQDTENGKTITVCGDCRTYRLNGQLHRGDGLPAAIVVSQEKTHYQWYHHGVLDREEWYTPVVCFLFLSNTKTRYKDGKVHRDDDLPAVICYIENYQVWYQNGVLHRNDGTLPAIIRTDYRAWFGHGKLFREEWYKNGELHHDGDLPALINARDKREVWYVTLLLLFFLTIDKNQVQTWEEAS